MRRQWSVHESGGGEEPGLAVALHDKGRGTVVEVYAHPIGLRRCIRLLGQWEVRHVETYPLAENRVPLGIFASLGLRIEVHIALELATTLVLGQPYLFGPRIPGRIGGGAVI